MFYLFALADNSLYMSQLVYLTVYVNLNITSKINYFGVRAAKKESMLRSRTLEKEGLATGMLPST